MEPLDAKTEFSQFRSRLVPGLGESRISMTADLHEAAAATQVTDRRTNDRQPIRVLLVAPTSRYVGGQAVQAKTLYRCWEGDKDIAMKFLPVDPQVPRSMRWTLKVRYVRTLVRTLVYLSNLLREVPQADVVHIFSASYWSFLLAPAPAVLVAHLFRKKVLLNYRSGEADDHFRRWRWFVSWVFRYTDRIVVGSRYLCQSFAEFDKQAEVVPNVVDTDQFRFRLRAPLAPRLLCTRGFEPHYHIQDVLKAFVYLKARCPAAILSLVGTGPQEAELRALALRLGLRDVTFVGAVPHDQIPAWYDCHDIFVNASSIDNMPVSILEAFAAGLPVVSTNAGGIPFIVEDQKTGLLSSVGNAAQLSANIIRLLDDPDLASSLAARARLECAKYSWSTVEQQWLRVYRELLTAQLGGPVPATTLPPDTEDDRVTV